MRDLAQAYARLGNIQSRTGTANLGQIEQARQSYQRALDLYAGLGLSAGAPADGRRAAADALLATAQLDYNTYHEDAAEASLGRMLDLLGDRNAEVATVRLRGSGQRLLGDVRLRQGRPAEAVQLLSAAERALRELGAQDGAVTRELALSRERLARARVFTGDLDGALNGLVELLETSGSCADEGPLESGCRVVGVRLERIGDVYAAADRPSLGEPTKAVPYYERALRIQERIAAQDAQDRQARFDLAARCGKLGDAVWQSDPRRALALYARALATAEALVSTEQLAILRDSYSTAIRSPLILLGRTTEARSALTDALRQEATGPQTPYADRLGAVHVRGIWPSLLVREGRRDEARRALEAVIADLEGLRAERPGDLTPAFFLSAALREQASSSEGTFRRDALLRSAAVWHAWPVTPFTAREEQKDLAAASR